MGLKYCSTRNGGLAAVHDVLKGDQHVEFGSQGHCDDAP
jgi:hypothetical protein